MSSEPVGGPAAASDLDAVRAVAADYIEGWYAADAPRMERSLHDDLVKRTPAGDPDASPPLREVSKERMVELTASGGGSDVAEPGIEVYVDAVHEDIAAARTVCVDYVDHLHLVRTPDGWRITDILFAPRG